MTHRARRLLIGIVAVLIAAFFAFRFVMFIFFPPPPFDGRIEGWMTPRFVSHAMRIPPEEFAPILGLKPEGGKRETLDDIADRLGVPVGDLISQIEALRPTERPEP
jgi:hypothetical protein